MLSQRGKDCKRGLHPERVPCYHLGMAKIIPFRKPEPEPPKAPPRPPVKSTTASSDLGHNLQYVGSADGQNWRCTCGHAYPRPPMDVLLKGTGATAEWLRPYIDKHENG